MEIPMMSMPWMGAAPAPAAKPAIEPSAKPKIDLRTENAPKNEKIEGVTGPEQKTPPKKPDFDSSSSTARSTLPKALKIDEASLTKSAATDETGTIDLSALKLDASGDSDAAIVAAEFFLPVPITLVPTPAALQPNVELASLGVNDVTEFETKTAISAELAISGGVATSPAPIQLSRQDPANDLFAPANDLATPEDLAAGFAPANDLELSAEFAPIVAPANDLATPEELAVKYAPANDLATPEELAFVPAPANDLETSAEFAPIQVPANDLATPEELAVKYAPANDLATPEELAMANAPANDLETSAEFAPLYAPANDLVTDQDLKLAQLMQEAAEAEELAVKVKINTPEQPAAADTARPAQAADVATPVKPATLPVADPAAETAKAEPNAKSDAHAADLLSKAPFNPANVAASVKNDAVQQMFTMNAAKTDAVDALREEGVDVPVSATDKAEPGFVMHVDTKAAFAPNAIGSKDRTLNAVETASVLKQVADRLEMLAAAKPKDGVTIQLDPGDLGQIILKVKGAGNDVSAEITAQHDGVRQALEQNKAQLSQNLEGKGLNLNQVTINTSTDAKQGFADAQTRQQMPTQPNNNNNRTAFGNEATGVVWGADQIRNYSRKATGVDLFA